ncbi:phage holin family protein [Flavobacterium daemonense]|uniref:phage holin family protein n=1 Tax=Flavobacterium daemonense TaxID=1393049 RepID=UPI0011851CB3|nr:phage holin family protein [Flavobacterium daemonense]
MIKKLKILLLCVAIITTFLTPIAGLLWLMMLFVLLDTSFGIYVSIKLEGLKSFKSHKLFNIVVKLFFYLMTIIMSFLVNKYLLSETLFGIKFLIPKIVTALWTYIEIKSIDESSMKLGNKSVWVLLKEMIDRLKGIKSDLNELIDEKKEK